MMVATMPLNVPAMVQLVLANHYKPAELLAMADEALACEQHHPLVTRHLLAAIALKESSGNPEARGDRDASGEFLAIGLFQFHRAAWKECWQGAAVPTGVAPEKVLPSRLDPKAQMRAAIRHLSWGARRAAVFYGASRVTSHDLASFHNRGNAVRPRTDAGKAYGNWVTRMMIVLKRKHTTSQPARAD